MKVYTDGNNINIVQTVPSASNMIGSLAHIAKDYILSRFQDGYFKHVYIDTSETVVQQNRNAAYNIGAHKIPYPSLTISPEISLDEPIAGMEKTLHLSSPNVYIRRDAVREYRKLLIDPDEKFSLTYTGDYITTNFNFKITTNTFMQNADVAFYLKSKFQKDFFQYLNNQNLQTEIPKSFIRCISEIKGWNLDNPDDMDSLRLYLIGTSKKADIIQKRRSLSTGKECFFVNDNANLLVLFTDLDCPSSISRNGQAEGEYVISFRLQVSTYLTNAFILSIDRDALKNLEKSTVMKMDTDNNQFEDGNITRITLSLGEILSRKDTIYFNDIEGNSNIGNLIYTNKYTFDTNQTPPTLFLLEELPEEYRHIHSYAVNKLNIDTSSLITVILYAAKGKLGDTYYRFNPENVSVDINNQFTDDFAVGVYVNRLLYESIKKAVLNDRDYFSNNYMTNMIAKIGNKSVDLSVKKFENKDDMLSKKDDKSLRIKTAYGIGYVSLLNDSSEDGYKICIGFDENNNPIIKRFEINKQ